MSNRNPPCPAKRRAVRALLALGASVIIAAAGEPGAAVAGEIAAADRVVVVGNEHALAIA